MKTNETTSRELALKWWKSLKSNIKLEYWRTYQKTGFTPSHSPDDLTGREIQNIWAVETSILQRQSQRNGDKPNQKQYKQFDESLFKAYIDKFSDEDKIKALNVLVCNISTVDTKFNFLLNQISNYK